MLSTCRFFVLCCFWIGALHALPSDPYELFKTMMGQKGMCEWLGCSQEQLWDIPIVQDKAKQPFNYYLKAIQYFKQKPINTIPKTIHFIWIGPKPFPEESISNLISWKKHHPKWKFFFWTDDPNRPLPIEGIERRLVSNFDFGPIQALLEESVSWGEKSDLMRYMILYKEGGVYSDHDVKCVRSFDLLVSHYDFVAGYEAMHNYTFSLNSPFVPNNGIILSCPHHAILGKTIERIISRWEGICKKWSGNGSYSAVERVFETTFDPFAYCASHFIDTGKYRNILLPVCFLQSYFFFDEQVLQELKEQGYVYAIHCFGAAWKGAKRGGRKKGLLTRPTKLDRFENDGIFSA